MKINVDRTDWKKGVRFLVVCDKCDFRENGENELEATKLAVFHVHTNPTHRTCISKIDIRVFFNPDQPNALGHFQFKLSI